MPGAGSGTLLFGKESSFKGSVTDEDGSTNPSYYHFGRNPSVDNFAMNRNLQQMREAGVIESVESVPGNFEGSLTVSSIINNATFDKIEDVVFNDSGTGFTTGEAQSAQVLLGSEYLDSGSTSNQIFELAGVIPRTYELTYNQGGMNRFSLTMSFADISDGSTPTDITSPSGGSDSAFHDFQLDIDSTHIQKLQSTTLTIDNLYNYQRGDQQTPYKATLAQPQLSLNVTAIWDDPNDQQKFAYGGPSATSRQDNMDAVSGTVDVDVDSTDITQYGLSGLKTNDYAWNNILTGDQDTAEQVTWQINNGESGISIT